MLIIESAYEIRTGKKGKKRKKNDTKGHKLLKRPQSWCKVLKNKRDKFRKKIE
jgi:hypothetical protein